jgi:hypothetical protein
MSSDSWCVVNDETGTIVLTGDYETCSPAALAYNMAISENGKDTWGPYGIEQNPAYQEVEAPEPVDYTSMWQSLVLEATSDSI